MKLSLGVLASMLVMLTSCKKEDLSVEESVLEINETTEDSVYFSEGDFWPMKVGNYWVYENMQIIDGGRLTSIPRIDSIYIEKDTIINGNREFVFSGNQFYERYNDVLFTQRDSLGNLIRGNIVASMNNSDTLTVVKKSNYETKLAMEKKSITIPAGTFQVLSAKTITHDLTNNTTTTDREMFAKGIGRVFMSLSYSPRVELQLRLLRYRVQ